MQHFPRYWLITNVSLNNPDSKVHGANMGPTWGRQNPGGPIVGHVNLVLWEAIQQSPKLSVIWCAMTLTSDTKLNNREMT